jgi:hypothetical protein
MLVNVAIVERKLLNFGVNSKPLSQVFDSLISNWIIIDSELNNVAFLIHEHLTQKLATK